MVHVCFTGQFPNNQTGYVKAMNWFSCLQPSGIDESLWSGCIILMGEAFENTVYHAKKMLVMPTSTDVEVIITNTMLQIRIWDNGPGFNLEQHIKDLPESVPLHAEKGRGVWIMNKVADHLNYSQTTEQLNCLTLQKFWAPAK